MSEHNPEPDETASDAESSAGPSAGQSSDRQEPIPAKPEQPQSSADAQADPPAERLSLDFGDTAAQKKRGRSGAAGVLIVAAAVGGVVGLIFGQAPALITATVFALPLLYIVWVQARRTVWLEGTVVGARTGGIRKVDLATASRIEVVITSVRGVRSIGLLVSGPPSGKSITVTLAMYSGTGGKELGILTLRRLADTLANNVDANGMIFSELLVAQLRAEARGDAAAGRPLYQLASIAPEGKLAQRFTMDAVSRFVANLDG
ncbi:hypothetical protein EV191_11492 [Tamaricihabitans halophyticus]|uniref:Uncharacterized protein n=1 Tax=Tamaricihabitans halophyticus TaxID=1262583 RepID=A0A4R2QH04_9PSEU|nr:hypothetical protein [Tamaricihabitans halophyticus]TCP46295.1 hypothetical protein EV191_11492 [Tamaricihabitans halophyticus]